MRPRCSAFGPSDFRIEGAVAGGRGGRRRRRRAAIRRSASWSTGSRPIASAASAAPPRRPRGRTRSRRPFAGRPAPTACCSGSRARRAARWSGRASPGSPGRGQHGVDGQAAGGFEKRSRSATPASPSPGRARRRATGGFPAFPSSIRRAAPSSAIAAPPGGRGPTRSPAAPREAPPGVFGTQFPADLLRQLIHELRTPLERDHRLRGDDRGPVYGPGRLPPIAAARRRSWSRRGACSARSTISTPRPGSNRGGSISRRARPTRSPCSCRLHDSYERIAAQRGARDRDRIAEGLPRARVEPGAAERMFARLLAGDDRPGRRGRDDPGGDRWRRRRRPAGAAPCDRPPARDRRA